MNEIIRMNHGTYNFHGNVKRNKCASKLSHSYIDSQVKIENTNQIILNAYVPLYRVQTKLLDRMNFGF